MREAGHDQVLLSAVRGAYTGAFHVAGLVAVAVMIVVVVLVARAGRAARTSATATEHVWEELAA